MKAVQVAIVGGGISGLAAAYYLGQRGLESAVIEKSNGFGGLIRTDRLAGCLLEAGPDSYISTKPAVTELAAELGDLRNQIISSNDTARRIFVAHHGQLVQMPEGMTMMVPRELTPALKSKLFSLATKRRFLAERFTAPRERPTDVTVAEFVADHFGNEVLERVADPLLAGVYGGDARLLSAQSVLPTFIGYEQRFGSLIRGVRHEASARPKAGLFRSFRDGMQSLTDALVRDVSGSAKLLGGEVTGLEYRNSSWRLKLPNDELEAESLVLACPAHVCANLLEIAAPTLAAELAWIPYSSAILVTLLYDRKQIRHLLDGFGFLVPRNERRTVAAATWINTKFPSRISAPFVAIRTFIVGEEAIRLSSAGDADLLNLVREDLLQFMGIEAVPEHSTIWRWPRSMPQYIVGHSAWRNSITAMLADVPHLHLVGNAYDGVGIPDCVRLAKQVAETIAPVGQQATM